MSATLAILNQQLAQKLEQIARLLPSHYKLTLVARNTDPQYEDADILMTDDDLRKAAGAIERRITKEGDE